MSPREAKLCATCGLPKSSSNSGSFTQWVSSCRCDLIAQADEVKVHICAACGRQIEKDKTGSFTQWILNSQACKCQAPVRLQGQASAGRKRELSGLNHSNFPLERYKPSSKLGEGGSGSVYLCFDKHLRKNVAVKVWNTTDHDKFINFQEEAKITAKIRHLNVVPVIDFGIVGEAAPYMVLEYVDGITLAGVLKKHGRLAEHIALPIFTQIAAGLAEGHRSGILHRDIKPSNVLIKGKINDRPTALIIDFGIAIMSGRRFDNSSSGRLIVGTPKYMAPDQVKGRDFDARSDIYAFGCLMYETLAGRVPFEGGDALSILRQHANEPVLRFSELSSDLAVSTEMEQIVLQCLAKNPDERFQSMEALRGKLEELSTAERTSTAAVLLSESDPDSDSGEEEGNHPDLAVSRDDSTVVPPGSQPDSARNKWYQSAHTLVIAASALLVLACAVGFVFMKLLGVETEPGIIAGSENSMSESSVPKGLKSRKARPSLKGDDLDQEVLGQEANDDESIQERKLIKEQLAKYKKLEAQCTRAINNKLNEQTHLSSDLFLRRGVLRTILGKYTEAEKDLSEAIKLNPRNAANFRARSELFWNLYYPFNDWPRADAKGAADADRAIALEPSNYENYLLKAKFSLGMPWTLPAIDKALSLRQQSSTAWAAKALALFALQKTSEAKAASARAIALEDRETEIADTSMTDVYLSEYMYAQKDYDGSFMYCQRAIKKAPLFWWPYRRRAAYYILGKHDPPRVLDSLNKAITLNPYSTDLRLARVDVYRHMDRDEIAFKDLNRIIELAPEYDVGYVQRAEMYLRNGKSEDAIKDLDHALKLGAKNSYMVYKMKAEALADLDRIKEAEASFTEAIRLHKNYDFLYYERAELYAKESEYEKAIADYSMFLKLRPNDTRGLGARAAAYEKTGKLDLARRDRAMIDKDLAASAIGGTQRAMSTFDRITHQLEKSEGIESAKHAVIEMNKEK